MANQIELVITARNNATRALEELRGQIESLSRTAASSSQLFDAYGRQVTTSLAVPSAGAVVQVDRLDTSMRRAAQGARIFAVPLAAELAPALGQSVSQMASVVPQAALMGTVLGGLSVAAVGLASVVGVQLIDAWQKNRRELEAYTRATDSAFTSQEQLVGLQRVYIEKLRESGAELTRLTRLQADLGEATLFGRPTGKPYEQSAQLKAAEREVLEALERYERSTARTQAYTDAEREERAFQEGQAEELRYVRARREREAREAEARRERAAREAEARREAIAQAERENLLLGTFRVAPEQAAWLQSVYGITGLHAQGRLTDAQARARLEAAGERRQLQESQSYAARYQAEMQGAEVMMRGALTGEEERALVETYREAERRQFEHYAAPYQEEMRGAEVMMRGALTGEEERALVEAYRERELKDARDLLSLNAERSALAREILDAETQILGMSTRQREAIQEIVAAEKLRVDLDESIERERVARLADRDISDVEERRREFLERRYAIEAGNRAYLQAARDDPRVGLGKGLDDVIEAWGAAGTRMQSLALQTATSMAQAFDEGLFSVLTGDFKKLESVGTDFGRNILRNITRELSQYATAAALAPLREGLAQIFGQAPGGGPSPFLGTSAAGAVGSVISVATGPGAPPAGAALLPTSYTGVSPIPTSGGPVASFLASPVLRQQARVPYDVELQAAVNRGDLSATDAALLYDAAATRRPPLTYGQVLGAGVNVAMLGITAYGASQQPTSTEATVTSAVAGGVSGAVLGAQIGAQIGSGYGGTGAAVGAVVGAGLMAAINQFFGAKPPKLSASERSARAAQEAQSALSEALGRVATLEEAVMALNAQYSAARELIVTAGQSGVVGQGPEIFPEAFRERQGGHRLFEERDLLLRQILDTLEVQTGPTGQAARDERLTDLVRGQIEDILRREASIKLQYQEPALAGLATRTTQLPFTRRHEAGGRDIDVLGDQLLRLSEADAAKFLVKLAKVDHDHDIGIIKLDDGQIITLSRFTFLPDPVTPVHPDTGDPGRVFESPGFLDPIEGGTGEPGAPGGASAPGFGAGLVTGPGGELPPGFSIGPDGSISVAPGMIEAALGPGPTPAQVAGFLQSNLTGLLGVTPSNPMMAALLGVMNPTALGTLSSLLGLSLGPIGLGGAFQGAVGLAGQIAAALGIQTSQGMLAQGQAALTAALQEQFGHAAPAAAQAAAAANVAAAIAAIAAGHGFTSLSAPTEEEGLQTAAALANLGFPVAFDEISGGYVVPGATQSNFGAGPGNTTEGPAAVPGVGVSAPSVSPGEAAAIGATGDPATNDAAVAAAVAAAGAGANAATVSEAAAAAAAAASAGGGEPDGGATPGSGEAGVGPGGEAAPDF